MTSARQNRGTGNGGAKYRESSFWDAIEAKKKEKDCESKDRNIDSKKNSD